MDLVRGQPNSKANPRVLFAWQTSNVGDSQDGSVPSAGRRLRGGFFQPFADLVTFRVLGPTGAEVIAPTAVDPTDPANQLDAADTIGTGGKGRIIVLPFTI